MHKRNLILIAMFWAALVTVAFLIFPRIYHGAVGLAYFPVIVLSVTLAHIFGGNPVLLATCLEDREHPFVLVFGFRYSACSRTGFFQSILLLVRVRARKAFRARPRAVVMTGP